MCLDYPQCALITLPVPFAFSCFKLLCLALSCTVLIQRNLYFAFQPSPSDSYERHVTGESYNRFSAYSDSKLANVLFCNALSRRFIIAGSAATCNSLHPGVIRTPLAKHVKQFLLGSGGLREAIAPVSDFLESMMMMAPADGALTQIFLAAAQGLEGVNGKYFNPIAKEARPSALALDFSLQERLWAASERLVSSKV